jgi:nitrogen regulatory protein PII-like uncharacterized protein
LGVASDARRHKGVAGFFLSQYNGITVMLDTLWSSNDSIELFTDSVGGRIKGFGIYF